MPFEANVEFENLVFNEQKKLKKVTRHALRNIAEAKKDLESALHGPNERVMRHFKIIETKDQDKSDIQKIIGNYNRLIGILLGHERVRYDGEQTGPAFGLGKLFGIDAHGYVRSCGPLEYGELGEVKIVKPNFSEASFDNNARMIIHEVAHKFLGMRDHKYYKGSTAIKISQEEAMENADTYANFAIQVERIETESLSVTR